MRIRGRSPKSRSTHYPLCAPKRRGPIALLFWLVLGSVWLAACGSSTPVVQSVSTTTPAARVTQRATSSATTNMTAEPRPGAISIAGWNVGMDDADPAVIAQEIAAIDDIDLWGLAEVNQANLAGRLEQAAEQGEGADFAHVLGQSGSGMRLLAIYDADRFELLGSSEIDAINTTGNARAPLVLDLRDRASGLRFLFMVNHLYRSREEERHQQARLLAAWAATQTLPVLAVGDYNFDWETQGGATDHDLGYDLMTTGGVWQWIKPAILTTTQCSGWPCRYNSVLDFIFAAGAARTWPAASAIVVRPGDFPDDTTTSDHRPVMAWFWPPAQLP